jgi:hypothetical protein
MSLTVEIFRSDDYVPDREIPLVPVLQAVFASVTGPDLSGVLFDLLFYQILDLTPDYGVPALENLRPSHGYVRVRILRDGEVIYQHPHPVREIIGEPLRSALRQRDPEVTHWGYGVRGPGLEWIALTRPAPQVAHQTGHHSGPWPRLNLTVEEVPDPEPPEATRAALGVPDELGPEEVGLVEAADADPTAPPVGIVIPEAIVSSLVSSYPFSDEIEEGGFLTGTVYRDAERPGGYLVHVTEVVPAERTGASMLNFTFTGESFLRISQQLESRGGEEKLLGWYHTHLFAATATSGLSSVDVELHRSTFRRPWQVAALVNIGRRGRVLRFYHGEGEEMALVPYWEAPSADASATAPADASAAAGDDAAPAPATGTDQEMAAQAAPESETS